MKTTPRTTPFRAYLRDINAYRPLSREEEQEAALRWRASQTDGSAPDLIQLNLGFVVRVALGYFLSALARQASLVRHPGRDRRRIAPGPLAGSAGRRFGGSEPARRSG